MYSLAFEKHGFAFEIMRCLLDHDMTLIQVVLHIFLDERKGTPFAFAIHGFSSLLLDNSSHKSRSRES